MERRDFIASTAVLSGALLAGNSFASERKESAANTFNLKYAPHLGMFKNLAGEDPIDQLLFMADQGFTAFEDNGMKQRSVDLQEKMAKTMEDKGMTMGVFVAHTISWSKPSLTTGESDSRELFLKEIGSSVEVAKRVNAKWMTVVPGHVDLGKEMAYQTVNVLETLRMACEILEPHGLVMVLEPLNWWANHAGQFLSEIPQAFEICRAVDSPSCKILFDIYHQQITEGNIIPNINKSWDEIAYFQIGDNPGRNEPTTGEINYQNIFSHIHKKGFTGILGMEHGNSMNGKEGELAVVEAYKKVDSFL